MVKATSVIPSGDAFTVEPYKVDRSGLPHTGRTFLLQVKDDGILIGLVDFGDAVPTVAADNQRLRIENHFDRRPSQGCTCDGIRNALTRHVGELLVHELRRKGSTLAHQASIQPIFGDALKLPKKVKFRFFARITPLGIQQSLRDMKNQC